MSEIVTCIIKGDGTRYSDCRCITGIRTDGWRRYTREQAHEQVKGCPGSILVISGGSTVDVIAAEREGLKYVRTAPDDTTADNLLKVKEC